MGRVVGLCFAEVAPLAEVGDGHRLHDFGEGACLADAASPEPDRSVVARRGHHGQQMRCLVRPVVKTFLQGQREQRRRVNLLLRALGICDQLPRNSRRALHGSELRHELRLRVLSSRLRSTAG